MDNQETLIEFNHLIVAYDDFLLGKDNTTIYQDKNIIELQTLFALLLFLLNIEKINFNDKVKDEYFDDQILDQIIQIIAQKRDNKYYLGKKTFFTAQELIKTIRDKFAHGDFFLDSSNNQINLKSSDEIIPIDMEKFPFFIIALISRADLYTYSSKYKRNQIITKNTNIKKINYISDIDQFISNINIIEYTFFNTDPYQKELIEKTLHTLPHIIEQNNIGNINDITSIIRKIFNIYNIKTDISITRLSSLEIKNKIKQFIINNFQEFSKLNLINQINFVTNWVNKIYNENNNIKDGITYNIYLLDEMKSHSLTSLDERVANSSNTNINTSIIEMYLTNKLLNFYIHYQYPLENICKSKENSEDEYYFDYSKLDLSMFHPSVFKLPKGRKTSYEQEVEGAKKTLAQINSKLNALTNQQNNIRQKLTNSSSPAKQTYYMQILKSLDQKTSSLIDDQITYIVNLNSLEKRLKEYTLSTKEGYNYNRYLIEYIRNAIAHGSVYYSFFDTKASLDTCKIRFVNQYEGETLLDLTTNFPDFEKLFNEENMSFLNDFLITLINKK